MLFTRRVYNVGYFTIYSNVFVDDRCRAVLRYENGEIGGNLSHRRCIAARASKVGKNFQKDGLNSVDISDLIYSDKISFDGLIKNNRRM